MFGPFKKKNEEEKREEQVQTQDFQEVQKSILEQPEEVMQEAGELHIECEAELYAVKDQLVRIGADFQNFKKRTERDRFSLSQAMAADIFLGLLPVIDNFDRALEHAKKTDNNPELASWLAGFELIYKSLNDFLKKNRVEPIEQLQTFDPNLHEALMQVEDSGKESGAIIQVFERGFMIDNRVLRPAKVSVAR